MDEPASVTLGQLAGPDVAIPSVVRLGEADTVVLDLLAPDAVQVWREGEIHQQAADQPVATVTDPEAWQTAIRRALLALSFDAQRAAAQLTSQAEHHEAKLAQIRQYAIDAHRAGTICRDGLDMFLSRFELAPYRPQLTFRFVFVGRYLIDGTDPDTARSNAEAAIFLVTEGICHLDDEASAYATRITTVRPVVDQPQLEVAYELAGQMVIEGDDVDHAIADVAGTLTADLTEVAAFVPGSATSELHLRHPDLSV